MLEMAVNGLAAAVNNTMNSALNFTNKRNSSRTNPIWIIGIFCLLAIGVWVVVSLVNWNNVSHQSKSHVRASAGSEHNGQCPKTITRDPKDGTLRLDTGEIFHNMNDFQQWWHATQATGPDTSKNGRCAIPRMLQQEGGVGSNEGEHWSNDEPLWAKTPINSVLDYEFSRIFGYEKGGNMIVPRQQNIDMILEQRAFDVSTLPLSSEERKDKYKGYIEGFTTTGELGSVSVVMPSMSAEQEARTRYNEQSGTRPQSQSQSQSQQSADSLSLVEGLVQRAYAADSQWSPVLVRTGINTWEVNELVPKRRLAEVEHVAPVDERVVDEKDSEVPVSFKYRQQQDQDVALGGFEFNDDPASGLMFESTRMGPRVSDSDGSKEHTIKPDYRGRMELPFAPSTNRLDWTVKAPGWN